MRNAKIARLATVAAATAAWIPNSEARARSRRDAASTVIERGTRFAEILADRPVMVAAHARDAILLVGDPKVQRLLGLITAPRVFNATLPLDAITIIEREATRLHTVAVSTDLTWAPELREFLAADYPAIRVLLVTPT